MDRAHIQHGCSVQKQSIFPYYHRSTNTITKFPFWKTLVSPVAYVMRQSTNSSLSNFAICLSLSFPYLCVILTVDLIVILTPFISAHMMVFQNSLPLLLLPSTQFSCFPVHPSPIVFHSSSQIKSLQGRLPHFPRGGGIYVLLQHTVTSLLKYLPHTTASFCFTQWTTEGQAEHFMCFLFFSGVPEYLTSHSCLIHFVKRDNINEQKLF